ncbi:MAG: signal peptide peptidase SppA [Dysgonamonadaceae bacterium]
MKDFPKIMFASALGFIIAYILLGLIMMIVFAASAGSIFSSFETKGSYELKDNSVLHMKLTGTIQERVADDELSSFFEDQNSAIFGLNDVVGAIRKAKNNDKIKGIYLEPGVFSASSATLAEIRQELEKFKESGKFIISYSDSYSQGGYYLASVADKIVINPQGMMELHGLASVPMFYKDALDKLGIKVQVFKVGTFKSAVEPFIQNEMSEANRQQITAYLNDIWSFMRNDIATSREIAPAQVDSIVNKMLVFDKTETLVAANLIDTTLYETEMKAYLREMLDLDKDAKINSASIQDMKNVNTKKLKKTDNTIGILYAQGNISSGTGSSNIQDKYMVDQIEKLRKDKDIKAVVFRVNSGGGSAYASEQIWKAISDLKKEKPVVVSMGDLAASGGYYISCNADKIVAQPTTLTGSIGIFGMIPDMQGTSNKIGIHTDEVKTHEYSDFGNIFRPLNEGESAMFQKYINNGYDLFLSRCAEGRGMPKDSLAKYAEGRVWTGNQAKQIGLVDELGGIQTAIDLAAELANLGKSYVVFEYPKLKPFWEEFFSKNKEELVAKTLKETLGESYEMFMLVKNLKEQDYMQARMPFDPNIN